MRKARDKKAETRVSRPELIKQGGLAGAALAVAGAALDGAPATAAHTGQLILPLSLDSFVQFESFTGALGDPAVGASLADNTTLPVSAQQLVWMVNDPQFVSHTHEVLAAFDQWVRGQQSKDSFLATAGTLRSYVTPTYPAALDALATYSKSAYPQHTGHGHPTLEELTHERDFQELVRLLGTRKEERDEKEGSTVRGSCGASGLRGGAAVAGLAESLPRVSDGLPREVL